MVLENGSARRGHAIDRRIYFIVACCVSTMALICGVAALSLSVIPKEYKATGDFDVDRENRRPILGRNSTDTKQGKITEMIEQQSVPYIAIYRATTMAPPTPLSVVQAQVNIDIARGPLSFNQPVPVKFFGPNRAGMTLGERPIELPADSYLVLSTSWQLHGGSEQEHLALTIAEAASLITLRFPHLLDEKLFEGFVISQGQALVWPESAMTLTASPDVDLDTMAKSFSDDFSSMQRLDPQTRDRVQLAARWFRRGHEAQNSVDKFLYWWITLEICLVAGTNKTVKHVQRMLRDEVYPNVCVQELEKHLLIKRIYRMRNEIVHRGIAFADDEDRDFRGYLRRLRAIATVSLRLLCGQAPGDDLEEFIMDNQSS